MAIEIHKSGDQFFVRNKARNGKVLHSSETEKQFESVIKNIKATQKLYGGSGPLTVYDCTSGKKNKLIIE